MSCTSYADNILKQMSELEEIGLSSTGVAEFNAFKTKLNNLRKLLPDEVPCTDITFAHKLVVAVRKLGPLVTSELNNAMRIDGSKGHLGKTKTTILSVLSEMEPTDVVEHSRALLATRGDPATGGRGQGAGRGGGGKGRGGGGGRGSGRGRGRGDSAPSGGHPDRPWCKEDGFCRWCKVMGKLDGAHWNGDHPDIPAAKAKMAADNI